MKRALPSVVTLSDEPFEVLLVCTGNRARSPFAAALASHLWRERESMAPTQMASTPVVFTSAGTQAVDGLPIDALMRDELIRRGVDAPSFASRHLTRSLVESADLVLTMDSGQRSQVLRDHAFAARRLFTLGQFLVSAGPIQGSGSLPVLVDEAYRARRHSTSDVDVPDPHGHGAAAAEGAAHLLEHLTERLVELLAESGANLSRG